MACKSYLQLLALIVMSVFASARRPPVVENYAASMQLSAPISEDGGGKLKVSRFAPQSDGSWINGVGNDELGNGNMKTYGDEKPDSPTKGLRNEKTYDDGNGKLKPNSTQPDSMVAIGLIPIIPGGDGSFHFDLGPIDFGGNIGWGRFAPGYVVPYSQPQPYLVVSPYFTSSPYQPPVTGYGQPSQGYYSPVSGYGQPSPAPGYGQPSQGYSGPYSSARGNAPPMQYGQPSQGYSGPYATAPGNAPSSSQYGG